MSVDEQRLQSLVDATLDKWRCPQCGQEAYTQKAQGALMVKCAGDHGKTLVWMERVSSTSETEAAVTS